jgi:hypothetical protein
LQLLITLAGLLFEQVLQFGVGTDGAERQCGVVDEQEVLRGEAVVEGAWPVDADDLDRDSALDRHLIGPQIAWGRGEPDDDRIDAWGCEHALSEVLGQVLLHAQFTGEHTVALGVCIAQPVSMLGSDLLIGVQHRLDDLASEFLLVGKRLFEVGPITDVARCRHGSLLGGQDCSLSQRIADRLGMKKYSPPCRVLKLWIPCTRRGGDPGTVK